ncbi:MAG TPA: carboxypeptidase regulatory-like domain-containing protein [Pyrinomonadaceae bacterium]|nr:carboxypeptidase regulatory-like domain-containing protein [Pyrinomonadaceae bacterium]
MKTQRSLIIAMAALGLLSLWIGSPVLAGRGGALESVSAPKTVKLTITVLDPNGRPVADAEVNITHDAYGPEFRAYDYHLTTNADGVATTDIEIGNKWGEGSLYWPVVDIEVKKDLLRGSGRVRFTGNWYRNPETGEWGLEKGRAGSKFVGPSYRPETCTIVLHPTDSTGAALITVKVRVKRDVEEIPDNETGDAIEGASVLISGDSPSERAEGTTGSDGIATVSVPVVQRKTHGIQVSKSGYVTKSARIELGEEQLGTIVDGPTVTLSKASGVEVVVRVKDQDTHQGIADARVSLSGPQPHSQKTDGSGNAIFFVKEIGAYSVDISQDHYEPASGQIRVRLGEEEPVTFELKAKEKVEKDTIEVTVLKNDPSDPKAKPQPLPGAEVVVNGIGTPTDREGKATLQGRYALTETVIVTAEGYTPKSRTIPIRKEVLSAKSYGSATFILDPDLSDSSPIRLVVEVRDSESNNLIQNANAYLYLNDQPIGGEKAPAGEATFVLKDSANLPLSKLRQGIRVVAKARDYDLGESDIKDLKPSLDAYRPTVFLKKTSAETKEAERIRIAMEELEKKVNAWKTTRPNTSQFQNFIDSATSDARDAHVLMNEFEAAANALPELTTFGGDSLCSKVAKLQMAIRSNQSTVKTKGSEIQKNLKDAAARAPRCASAAEAENLRATYRQAIKDLSEMGRLKSEAARSQQELSLLVYKASAAQRTFAQMKDKAARLQTLALASKENEAKAVRYVNRIGPAVRSSSTTQYSLQIELNNLLATVAPTPGLPADLAQRVKAMRDSLEVPANDLPTDTSIVSSAAVEIGQLEASANAKVEEFENKVCPVITLDDAIEDINRQIDDAGLEIGLANDLQTQADLCIAKVTNRAKGPAAQTNTTDKSDEPITVEIDPGTKEKQAVSERPDDKTAKSNKSAEQTNSSGGFWDAAKKAKKDVEDKATNKSNTQNNPSITNENNAGDNRGTNTVANATDSRRTNPPTVEEIPEVTVTKNPSTYDDRTVLKNPPKVEEIPEDNTTNVASNKPASRSRSKPPVVEEIPETNTNVNSNRQRSNPPVVEEIPETNQPASASNPTNNEPRTSGSSANNQPSSKPKKEKKPRDPNKPDWGTRLGGAIRTAVTGQPPTAATNNPGGNTNPGEGDGSSSDYGNLNGTWGLYTKQDEENYSQITMTLGRAGSNTWTGQSTTTMHVSEESAKYFLPYLQGDIRIVTTGPGTLRMTIRSAAEGQYDGTFTSSEIIINFGSGKSLTLTRQ